MEATSPQPPELQDLPATDSRDEKPGQLILYAFGWLLLAEIASGFAAFVCAFTTRAIIHGPGVLASISYPLAVFSTQGVMLLAALHRGRMIAGGRPLSLALGYVPAQREWPIIPCGVIIILWTGLFALAQVVNPPRVPSSYAIDVYSALATGGWVTTGLIAISGLALAPITEELFFRGWLWEGLRRRWSTVPVMFGTALPWLLMHVIDDWRTVFTLAPQAVCFSLARHFCGTVRATMALHVLNNLIALGVTIWIFKGPR